MSQTYFGDKPIKVVKKSYRGKKGSALRFFEPLSETFEGVIETLEKVHKRTNFYVMGSGGKDSMCVADQLSNMGKLKAMVYIRTNVGFEATTDFVKDVCKERGWKLHIIDPDPKFVYASFVLQYGFSGAEVTFYYHG